MSWSGFVALRLFGPEEVMLDRLALRLGMRSDERTPTQVDFASLPTVKDVRNAVERHDELLHAHD